MPDAVRQLPFDQAIREALDTCLARDPRVYVMGLGVPDPKGVFGTTLGLAEKHGPERVMDMPVAENGMTGVALGSALAGMRPVLTHQRVDFALLSMEYLVNQAAKWHYMFGGRARVPMVVRMIIGRGWGQGPQHSQSLQAWFAHVPGLKVVMPATPHDAKGLLIASIEDDNPVVFLEHRWLHAVRGPVPEGYYRVPLGKARRARAGNDLTVLATSYMVLEALRAADVLARQGVLADVIDVRTLRPLDEELVLDSVQRTGRVIVADTGHKTGGFSAELVALVAERAFSRLRAAPERVALPDHPTPTSPALANPYYPRAKEIVEAAARILDLPCICAESAAPGVPLDVPDPAFVGPF